MHQDTHEALNVYKSMVLARKCDEYERSLIRTGISRFQIGGSGSESTAYLRFGTTHEDQFYLHWRDRALRIALGIEVTQLAKAFFGLYGIEGCDKNLTCHESNHGRSVFPITTPTASHCLPACGAAMSKKEESPTSITICSLGDGGSRQGEFAEAVAFSQEKSLPILWVIVDNSYAISTSTIGKTAIDLEMVPSSICHDIDAQDTEETIPNIKEIIQYVRKRSKPQIIRLKVPRLQGHTSHDDETQYRSEQHRNSELKRDPIVRYKNWLLNNQAISEDKLVLMEQDAHAEVKQAYDNAHAKWGNTDGKLTKEFREIGSRLTAAHKAQRISDAVNESLKDILSKDQKALLIGEDIEDPLGGVFRLTKTLSTKFPGRVQNTPLAEATILGVALGRATTGKTTIAEIQFMDFLSPGWNQLTTNIVSQAWRTDGVWPSPVIIYAVAGAYSPGAGMFHSQVNASLLTRNEGLVVVYPSSPNDVMRVFQNAHASNTPTFILLPKARLWERQEQTPAPMQDFSPTLVCSGSDLTIVTWGNGVAISKEALRLVDDISIDLIDLCYLNPLDLDYIANSVCKTKRLLVVDEDVDNCSLGGHIIQTMCTNTRAWESLCTPPRLLARKSQYIPTNEADEKSILPFPNDVAAAIRDIMNNK